MQAHISKSEFKAKALEYFRQVEATGEAVVITDHGNATLELRRFSGNERSPAERLRNTVSRYEGPFEPVAADDWEALK
jgi:hypothetical protein